MNFHLFFLETIIVSEYNVVVVDWRPELKKKFVLFYSVPWWTTKIGIDLVFIHLLSMNICLYRKECKLGRLLGQHTYTSKWNEREREIWKKHPLNDRKPLNSEKLIIVVIVATLNEVPCIEFRFFFLILFSFFSIQTRRRHRRHKVHMPFIENKTIFSSSIQLLHSRTYTQTHIYIRYIEYIFFSFSRISFT